MELSGNLFDYFIVFGAGVALSFTPCVYPLLPVVASFVAGINTKGGKFDGFIISVVYVLGIAITYCTFAVIAALTGQIFGWINNSFIVYFFLFAVFLFLGFVMLDVIKIKGFNIDFTHRVKGKGLFYVLFFGMASGLIVGPCTAPILGALLAYVASRQHLFHSISLMFVFSYGVGFSIILVGTFSGILEHIPKPGKWLIWVKKICGVILLIVSLYFLRMAIIYTMYNFEII